VDTVAPTNFSSKELKSKTYQKVAKSIKEARGTARSPNKTSKELNNSVRLILTKGAIININALYV
jgi:hypothetical protein